MSTNSNPPARLPRPRWIGRLVRIVLGAILLYFFVNVLVAVPWAARDFLATQTGWRAPAAPGGWLPFFAFGRCRP